MPAIVKRLIAREILDSRGNPTVEVSITAGDQRATASVPSGKSTGRFEALERRDKDSRRYGGQGVLGAVAAVNNEIAPAFLGQPLPGQWSLDSRILTLDGTDNKSRLGANAILAVSIAAARVRSALEDRPLHESLTDSHPRTLPVPCFNVINGGAHAPNALDFQEFMFVPAGLPSFSDALRAGAETYHALAKLLDAAGLSTAVGDEGGFAPELRHPTEAFNWMMRAVEATAYRAGEEMFFAIDPAASEFFSGGRYRFAGNSYDAAEMRDLYSSWYDTYPIISIEDGLAEEDVNGWKRLTEFLGARVQLVGDDIFVSDPKRISWAIEQRIGNAVLLKPNQIGTVSEIIEAATVAKTAGYRRMVSHRSGETDDSFIADLAVALGTGQIKAGAPTRGERLAKYNQLLRIEESIGARATYAGLAAFKS